MYLGEHRSSNPKSFQYTMLLAIRIHAVEQNILHKVYILIYVVNLQNIPAKSTFLGKSIFSASQGSLFSFY